MCFKMTPYGIPMGHSRFRIWHFHCCSSDWCCGMVCSLPQELPLAMVQPKKKKKRTKNSPYVQNLLDVILLPAALVIIIVPGSQRIPPCQYSCRKRHPSEICKPNLCHGPEGYSSWQGLKGTNQESTEAGLWKRKKPNWKSTDSWYHEEKGL